MIRTFSILLALSTLFGSVSAREIDQISDQDAAQNTVALKQKQRPQMPRVEDVFKTKNKTPKASDLEMPVGKGGSK